jgi:hypothetical protein
MQTYIVTRKTDQAEVYRYANTAHRGHSGGAAHWQGRWHHHRR